MICPSLAAHYVQAYSFVRRLCIPDTLVGCDRGQYIVISDELGGT